MSTSESRGCRPFLGKDRNRQSVASENGGEVTLDNLTQKSSGSSETSTSTVTATRRTTTLTRKACELSKRRDFLFRTLTRLTIWDPIAKRA
jgi:hypothetical protein